jgi:protein-tyrosine phosphatase
MSDSPLPSQPEAVASSLAEQRVIELEGGSNLRDLGGLPTADGAQVRRSIVYRSGGLHRLRPADLEVLRGWGLKVVYDMRSEQERGEASSRLPEGLRVELLPIGGDAARTSELWRQVMAREVEEVPTDFLHQVYDSLIVGAGPTFGALLRSLAAPEGTPAIIHCTAGKDRTGMASAILLRVLGVEEELVLDDYELSAIYYTERQIEHRRAKLEAQGLDPDRFRALFGAPRSAMASLLATLDERYGSVEGYLEEEADVDAAVVTALRARLVEPSDGR